MSRSPTATSTQEERRAYSTAWSALHRLLRQGKSESGHERNCLFLNTGTTGGGRFATVSAVTGMDFPDDARGQALCDWNHDGRVDFWITNRTAPRVRLMMNNYEGSGNAWVSLRLHGDGKTVNRDAIGARVAIHVTGQKVPVLRTVAGGSGFLSQSSLWQHAGLGEGAVIEKVTVRWQGDVVEEFAGVSVRGFFDLVQGTGKAKAWTPPDKVSLPAGSALPEEEPFGEARMVLISPLPVPESFVPGSPGGKGLLLNLWSKDCPNCRAELKAWGPEWKKWEKAGVTVSAWCVDGTAAEAAKVAAAQGFAGPVLAHESLADTLPGAELMGVLNAVQKGVLGLQQDMPVPVSFLFDARRRLVAIYKGAAKPAQVVRDFSLLTAGEDARRRAACPDAAGRWRLPISPVGIRGVVAALLDDQFKEPAEKLLLAAAGSFAEDRESLWAKSELSVAHSLLGLYELERRNLKAAEQRYRASLEARVNPEARRGLVNTWMAARQKQLYPLIAEQLDALVKEKGDPGDMGKLGVLRLEMGDPVSAVKLLADSVAAVPDAMNSFQLGQAHRAAGRAAAAAEAWAECIRLKPDLVPALNNFAWLRATHKDGALRDGAAAVAMAESAVKLSGGKNPVLLGTLAAALAETGKFSEASRAAAQAEEMAKAAGQPAQAAKFAAWRAGFDKNEPVRE